MKTTILRKSLLIAGCFACILLTSGCSALMKWGYVQPADCSGWSRNDKSDFPNLPPTYLHTCGDITIEAVPAIIYDYTYSVGPWLFPVVPVFNVWGNSDLREEFSILLRLSPKKIVKENFAFDSHKPMLSITTGGIGIPPSGIRVYENQSDFVFINASFNYDLHKIESFMLSFGSSFPGCPTGPLRFEKAFKVSLEGM